MGTASGWLLALNATAATKCHGFWSSSRRVVSEAFMTTTCDKIPQFFPLATIEYWALKWFRNVTVAIRAISRAVRHNHCKGMWLTWQVDKVKCAVEKPTWVLRKPWLQWVPSWSLNWYLLKSNLYTILGNEQYHTNVSLHNNCWPFLL